jgi:hypothetical protein
MARSVRALTRILPALLLMLEAPPSVAASDVRGAARRAAVVAVVETNDVAPAPGAGPDDPRGFDAAGVAPASALLRPGTRVGLTDLAAPRVPSRERTWLELRRRRAPSPDDPDPS